MLGRLRDRLLDLLSSLREPVEGHGRRRVRGVLLRILCWWHAILLLPALALLGFGIWLTAAFAGGGSGFWYALMAAFVLALAFFAIVVGVAGAAAWAVVVAVDRRHAADGRPQPVFMLGALWVAVGVIVLGLFLRALAHPGDTYWATVGLVVVAPGALLGAVLTAFSWPRGV